MTDFIAEAESAYTDAVNARTGTDVESSRQLQALVAATIAVAKQQRIANLIAIGAYENADGSRSFQSVVAQPNGMYTVALDADIREGLGL